MSIPRSMPASLRETLRWRSLVLPGLAATLPLAAALLGTWLIRDQSSGDGVNLFVETLSGRSSSVLGDLGLLAPLGFAFAAGLVSAVNPCGFAMLPAYLGLYLGSKDETMEGFQLLHHLGRALLVGGRSRPDSWCCLASPARS